MIVGIDIGGTKTKLGTVQDGKLVELDGFPTPQDPDEAASALIAAIDKSCGSGPLEGIGIGCPGPLNQERGVTLSPPNLPDWDEFPIAALLKERFQVPVALENDGNAGGLGEALWGSGRGFNTVLYCTISTGIGIGIVNNGKVHQGHNGLAGETWAFIPGNYDGKPEGENILDLSAGNGIVRITKKKLDQGRGSVIPKEEVTTGTILKAYEENDPLAVEVLEQARNVLGGMLVNAITLLAPDIIVLAGGLCARPEWYVDPLITRVRKWTSITGLSDIPVRRAELWDSAVLYGAVTMMDTAGNSTPRHTAYQAWQERLSSLY